MSVLVPDLKIYEAVYQKALDYSFRKTCDINYCHTFREISEKKLQQHVKNWLYLNELSYIRRYEDGKKPELHEFLTFRRSGNVNTYQMLKFLNCIRYNIEIETIKNGKTGAEEPIEISFDMMESYNLLQKAIEEIMCVIIGEIDQYQEAKWSEVA